jgi:hypothetical protein
MAESESFLIKDFALFPIRVILNLLLIRTVGSP